MFDRAYDLFQPVYVIINSFDLGAHTVKMRALHPSWSYAQLTCVLYWQGTARKQLNDLINAVLPAFPGYTATWCPEGMGVDVTATLAVVGVVLEWPAVQIARQVALLGAPL
jgi:hypothetical protein